MSRTGALRALGAVALAAAMTGCLKVDFTVDIQEDETVDGHVIIGINRELAELSGQDTESISEELQSDAMDDAPEGVTAEPYEDDDFVGTRMVLDAVPLEDLDLGEGEDLSIAHEGDEYVLTGTFDMSDTGDFGDLGDGEAVFEGFASSMDVQLNVTFPGEVIEHNGELDDRTVTWTPEVGERLELQARAQDSGGSSFPWPIGIVVAGLLAIGTVAVLLMRRRDAAASPAPELVDPVENPVDAPYGGTASAPARGTGVGEAADETRPVAVADAAETGPVVADAAETGPVVADGDETRPMTGSGDADRADPDRADRTGPTRIGSWTTARLPTVAHSRSGWYIAPRSTRREGV